MASQRPTLSMWTPNYNHSAYVAKALESVLTQSRPPDQYIVADDASTDGSVKIIQPYAERYPCIEFFKHEKNKGAMGNLDFCLGKMTGDYIYGLSADDHLLPGWLEEAMKMAERYPEAGIIFGQTQITTVQGVYGFDTAECWSEPLYASPERFMKDYLMSPKRDTLLICSCIYNRKVFESVEGFTKDLPRYNDWWAFIACGLKAGACYVPMPAHSILMESGNNFALTLASNTDFYIDTLERFRARSRREKFKTFIPEYYVNHLLKRLYSWEISKPVWSKYTSLCRKRDAWLKERGNAIKFFARAASALYRGYCYLEIEIRKIKYCFYTPDLTSEDLEKVYMQKRLKG